jgi:hypothetical protein
MVYAIRSILGPSGQILTSAYLIIGTIFAALSVFRGRQTTDKYYINQFFMPVRIKNLFWYRVVTVVDHVIFCFLWMAAWPIGILIILISKIY